MHLYTMAQVVIDAFRLINPQTMMLGQEPRQTTSNLGHLEKPSIQVTRLLTSHQPRAFKCEKCADAFSVAVLVQMGFRSWTFCTSPAGINSTHPH